MKYIPFVNIEMGTKSCMRHSCGNTLPLVQMPFGMSSFSIQTDSDNWWFYNPDHNYAEGVRLTHQPSVWIGDCATFLMMPQNHFIANNAHDAWSGVKHSDKIQRPDYMKLKYLRTNCTFELTPTERGAAIRLEFFDDAQSFLSFLPVRGNYTYRYDADTCTLFGTNDSHAGTDFAVNCRMHFAVKFSPGDVDAEHTYTVGQGSEACIHIALTKRKIEARIAMSFISPEIALQTLIRECGNRTFEEIRAAAEESWEEKLHRIEIQAEDEKQMRTFYSCLYRVFLFPRIMHEYDGDKIIHYCPFDGSVKPGVRYASTGFWDTARTQFPLFSLIAKNEFAQMLEGFVTDYIEGGWLPRWPVIGELGIMPGTFIDCVIAEAAVRKIGSREVLEKGLEGMLHHANVKSEIGNHGRRGIEHYLKHGYVPYTSGIESVNLTLDFAYGDWCIATVAKALGHDELTDEYLKRSKNYANVYDPETGFMRARDENGVFKPDFDPFAWGGDYCEGSAWQTSFFVPHDIDGLAALHGGKDKLIAKLDELVSTEPHYRVHNYNGEIHEMTEMALVNFGQCGINNQPSFHIPFMFAALGEQKKTNALVERMLKELFSPEADGFPGDEDNGSMSAWYILASLGMYPVCPGDTKWVTFKRSVKSVKLLGKEI